MPSSTARSNPKEARRARTLLNCPRQLLCLTLLAVMRHRLLLCLDRRIKELHRYVWSFSLFSLAYTHMAHSKSHIHSPHFLQTHFIHTASPILSSDIQYSTVSRASATLLLLPHRVLRALLHAPVLLLLPAPNLLRAPREPLPPDLPRPLAPELLPRARQADLRSTKTRRRQCERTSASRTTRCQSSRPSSPRCRRTSRSRASHTSLLLKSTMRLCSQRRSVLNAGSLSVCCALLS